MAIGKLSKHLKKARLRVALPFVSYEVTLDDILDSKDVDERIKRLSTIKSDLADTVAAVEQLQADALQSKHEADNLKKVVEQLERDKSTAEEMLKLPEESFARLVSKASSKGRLKGIVEGALIGFVTGVLSSGLVWFLTKPEVIIDPPSIESSAVEAPAAEPPTAEEPTIEPQLAEPPPTEPPAPEPTSTGSPSIEQKAPEQQAVEPQAIEMKTTEQSHLQDAQKTARP